MLELGGYAGAWPTGLDPATNVNGAADQDQMNSIFGQLFQIAEGGKLIPDLANSATPSAGGKTWTIALQPDLKFSDGTPLDGAAVVSNWKRDFASPCTCKPNGLPPIKSITAPTATTVQISFAAPDGAFQNQLLVANLNWIASPTAIKQMGEQAFKIKPVGAGPFTVVSDTLSNTLVLKKNPNYWQSGRPYLDNLTFKATADDEAALEALQSGGAQAYDGMATPSLVSQYKSHFTTTEQPATSPYDIQLNTAAPPFNNVNARLAIYYATDAADHRPEAVRQPVPGGPGLHRSRWSVLLPERAGLPDVRPEQGQVAREADRWAERELLHTGLAGQPELHGGPPDAMEAGGINTSIHLYSLAGLIQQFVSKKWQAALQTAGAWDPAAGVGLGFRFLSASPFSGVHDPKLDALILGGQAAGRSDRARQDLPAGRAVHRQERRRAVPVPAGFLERRSTRRPGPRAHHGDSVGRGEHAAAVAERVVHAVRFSAQGTSTYE